MSCGKSELLISANLPALSDILFKRSTDNGVSFENTINLSNDSGWSFNPRMFVSRSNV